jgi:hypothetical protein
MKSSDILNYFGYGFLVILLFLGGFYFGYKNRDSQINKDSSEQIIIQTPDLSSSNSKEENSILAKNPDGVFWIKAGQEPICPKEFPIKGRYKDNSQIFYTPESKTYNRVKPDLCFANEDFALKVAGFIKQF